MNKLKIFLNEEKNSIFDYVVIGIIVICYSILSFINLGSFTNPQTFYTLDKNEEVVFKFSDLSDVMGIKLYNGEQNGKYDIYISSDNTNYTYINEIDGNGSFSWNEEKILKRTKYIKLIPRLEKSVLGEVAFYDNKKELIPIKNITSSISSKSKDTSLLNDETNYVPEEISYLNSTYFDEIYFARTAYNYVHHQKAYEWVHPPLGKLIQAIPIKVFNTMAPFFYRLMGNIAGILMIVVMYFFSKSLFKKRKYGILGALLMSFDCFHFAHTRMGTVDSFLVLFILLSYYFMCQYISKDKKAKYLFISGLFFGLSVAVKWTGLFAGLGLAIIFFIDLFLTRNTILKKIIQGFIFFLIIPLFIYVGCYLLFPNNNTMYTKDLKSIVEQQQIMYNYHSNLKDDHQFASAWYSWPASYKPVWYYTNVVDDYNHGTISGIGNIAIWWVGIISLIYLLYLLIKVKDKKYLLILIAIISMWLPYIFIGRVMFLYHFFPVLPFVMLSIVAMFNDLSEIKRIKYIIPIYIVVIMIVFILYYPAISGIVTSDSYLEKLKLLNSWYF